MFWTENLNMTAKDRSSLKVEKDGWVTAGFPVDIVGEFWVLFQHFGGEKETEECWLLLAKWFLDVEACSLSKESAVIHNSE